jgi:hypothetical protein
MELRHLERTGRNHCGDCLGVRADFDRRPSGTVATLVA